MLIAIDDDGPAPPGEQLRSQLVLLVVSGTLEPGARLPSVRQLAADLQLAPGTVARVYKELEASGHLRTSKTGTRVGSLGARADRERHRYLEDAAKAFAECSSRAGFRLREALDAVRRAYPDVESARG